MAGLELGIRHVPISVGPTANPNFPTWRDVEAVVDEGSVDASDFVAVRGRGFPGRARIAVGCISGAVAGGVAGHYAGHHGLLGAAAGCAVGHHLHKVEKERERQEAIRQHAYDSPDYQGDHNASGGQAAPPR